MSPDHPDSGGDERQPPGAGPLIGCDLPIEHGGLVAHNELVLTGWAAALAGVSGVVVQIDGRLLHASYGLDSPWLAKDLPDYPGAAESGYHLRVDTSGWAPGPREVTITAYDQDGRRADVSGQVDFVPFAPPKYTPEDNRASIAAGEVAMWLEEPCIMEDGCEVEGPVEIAGWAYGDAGVDAVMVTLDGRRQYEALRPIFRPDLLDDYGEGVSGGGFALRLDPRECPPGLHTLTVVAMDREHRAVGVQGELLRLPDPPLAEATGDNGDSAPIDWIDSRTQPRLRGAPIERYDPEQHAGLVLEAEHQLRYRWAMPLAAGRSVLDAGCGVGWGTAMLADAGAERVIGLDVSEEALEHARRRVDRDAVEFQQGDLQSLPFEDATFDLATCFEAIEHVPDPGAALDELRRVLRPDGVLLMSTPPRQPSARDNEHHVHEFTSSEFEKALRSRFANVSVHRQQTCMASVLVDDDALAVDDGTTGLDVDVRKFAVSGPGGEAYVVAVASDGDLPDLGRMAMLASPHAVQRLHEQAYTLEDRALLAEADAAASRNTANLATMHQRATLGKLRESEQAAEAMRSQLADTQAERDGARSELAETQAELEGTRTELAHQVAQRTAQLQASEARAEHAEMIATSQESSLSWRVTRPLRALKRVALLVRGALGGGRTSRDG